MAHFILVPIKETANNYKLQIYYHNLKKIRPSDFYQHIKAKYPRYMDDASDEDQRIITKRAKEHGRTVCKTPQRDVPKFYRTVPKAWRWGKPDEQHIRYRLSKLYPNEEITFYLLNWW